MTNTIHHSPLIIHCFGRGIPLEQKKETILLNALKRPYSVKRVRIPLCGGAVPCVRDGEPVSPGKKIADPGNADGVPVFAGIYGKTAKVETIVLPDGNRSSALEVLGDNEPRTPPSFPDNKKEPEAFSKEDLRGFFREKGLLTLDEKMKPLHSQVISQGPAQSIVINCCEPEPYVAAGLAVLAAHPLEVLKGAELLCKAASAEKAVFVFGNADREMFELIKSKIYLLKRSALDARMVSSVYPFDSEELLLRDFPEGTVSWNPATAYAAYEAVFCGKPFFERVVTVGGECVAEPRNLWLPVGFLFRDAFQVCKGFLREPRKVLAGGPMTGIAQRDLETPVTAGTDAILALPKEIVMESRGGSCVRCNRCVDACPVSISPAMITLAAEHGEIGEAVEWGVRDCVECGVCAYVCPACRPMLDLIRAVKPRR